MGHTVERRFRAMGTDCHVIMHGPERLAEVAEERVHELERLWSRFRADSDVSMLNAEPGVLRPVSAETIVLLLRAVRAAHACDGWFDPLMGTDIASLGYDRSFEQLTAARSSLPTRRPTTLRLGPGGGAARLDPPVDLIRVDRVCRRASIPVGYAFDPGGLGKGLAADVVSGEAIAAGATGVLVNLGGDLRCRGTSSDGGWTVTITNPVDADRLLDEHVVIDEGAVATSTAVKRTWSHGDRGVVHHLLDPTTGEPVAIEVASVTVIARAGWIAEALAKLLLIAGPEQARPRLLHERAGAVVVMLDGSVARLP